MQADSVPIRRFFANEIYHFSRLSFYLGSPLHIVSSLFLINSLISFLIFLFQNTILHKMLKLGFRNFKPIFLRMQFSLVATFFFSSFGYQFELIFASYNQLPDTSYLTLWNPNDLSKHLKGHQVSGLDLSTRGKLAVKWAILKIILNLGFNLNYFSFLL